MLVIDVLQFPSVGGYLALSLSLSLVLCSAPSVFTITEKAPPRPFLWLKAHTSAFTFKTLC